MDEPNTANSNITYNISEASFDMLGNFSIQEAVGLITLTGPLDYEKMDRSLNGSIILTVTAADRGRPAKTATTSVTINVQVERSATLKTKYIYFVLMLLIVICKNSNRQTCKSC